MLAAATVTAARPYIVRRRCVVPVVIGSDSSGIGIHVAFERVVIGDGAVWAAAPVTAYRLIGKSDRRKKHQRKRECGSEFRHGWALGWQ